MDLVIYVSFLGHLKCIKDGPFVRSTRKKNLSNTLHYLQNISPYIIIECKIYYVSFKKITKFKYFKIMNIDSLN